MEKVIVPGFILKLWKMINDPQCDDLISWSENGHSFIINNPSRFSQELSKYFKHNNLSSFIRQLNMYGFRKVATIENTGLHPGTEDLHFYHPDFAKDKPERLEAIKRKLPQKVNENVDLRNVIQGIAEISDNHKSVSQQISEMKRENEMLWAEIHDLRQKHQQQQLYISRLMKLVFEAMEQNGIKTNMLQLKRNVPLMIEGGDDSHLEKKTRLIPSEATTSHGVPCTVEQQGIELQPQDFQLQPQDLQLQPQNIQLQPHEIQPQPQEIQMQELRHQELQPQEKQPQPQMRMQYGMQNCETTGMDPESEIDPHTGEKFDSFNILASPEETESNALDTPHPSYQNLEEEIINIDERLENFARDFGLEYPEIN